MIGIGTDAHLVGFVTFDEFSSFIFGSYDASFKENTLLLGQEAESMPDMFLCWFFLLFRRCCMLL